MTVFQSIDLNNTAMYDLQDYSEPDLGQDVIDGKIRILHSGLPFGAILAISLTHANADSGQRVWRVGRAGGRDMWRMRRQRVTRSFVGGYNVGKGKDKVKSAYGQMIRRDVSRCMKSARQSHLVLQLLTCAQR